MTKEAIYELLTGAIVEIIPEIEVDEIQPEISLKDIGANSVDRMDIIVRTMELTQVNIPLVKFGGMKTIKDIVNLIFEMG